MKTYQPKASQIKRDWHLIDVDDQILGRTSTQIVKLLMGKHKPNYTPHLDMGDYVIVVNAAKVKLSGRKDKQKTYKKHSGYPGGFKEIKISKLRAEQPGKIIELAVRRMLPDNRLRDVRMSRLKVFANDKHPYADKLKNK